MDHSQPVSSTVLLAITLILIVSMWKAFTKAGQPGWAAIIPIYNAVVLFRIAGKPAWWVFLLLVPLINVVILFMVYISLAKNFGKGAGFGVGLVLLTFIFFPILAFGSARYQASSSAATMRA
jgi:hypothetical protein